MVNWKTICRAKEQEGLGIKKLEKMNSSLVLNGGGN
jgi:hypothetical protein